MVANIVSINPRLTNLATVDFTNNIYSRLIIRTPASLGSTIDINSSDADPWYEMLQEYEVQNHPVDDVDEEDGGVQYTQTVLKTLRPRLKRDWGMDSFYTVLMWWKRGVVETVFVSQGDFEVVRLDKMKDSPVTVEVKQGGKVPEGSSVVAFDKMGLRLTRGAGG
jgi:hypothetical protein